MSLSYQVVSAQVLVTLVAASAFALLKSPGDGLAALLGGSSTLLPAAYYAWRAGRERSPQRLLLLGVGKFVSTCVLLALAIIAFEPPPAGLFAALIACQLTYVVVPLLAGRRATKGEPR